MSTISHDKHFALLQKIGRYVQEQRIKVFQEEPDAFARRLNTLYDGHFTSEDVIRVEAGDGTTPIHLWMTAWQLMQVADKVADASKSDTALFLASAHRLSLDENHVRQRTPK
jgi:hypothetical protein